MTTRASTRQNLAILVVLTMVVVAVRWALHEPAGLSPILAPEVPDTWWAGIMGSHDWLLHGYDEGEWLALVNAYIDGPSSHVTRPPAYPLLAALLAKGLGHRILGLHLVGHAASILVCLATYAFGTRLANRSVGIGAALLMATAPRVIAIQDEIGAFSLLALALLCLASSSLATIQRPGPSRGIWLGLSAAFCLCAHYTSAPFVLPAFLLVLVCGRKAAIKPVVIATVISCTLAAIIYSTVPAKPVHSGGVSIGEFYQHALKHPDGRNLDMAPAPGVRLEDLPPPSTMDVFSADRPLGRTLREGPGATVRALAEGYGPAVLAPAIVGLMCLGIGWPRRKQGASKIERWQPALWLVIFLAPLPFAAAAMSDEPQHRYLTFSFPFAAVAFARGVDRLAHWIGPRLGSSSAWSAGFAAIPLCIVLAHSAYTNMGRQPPHRDHQLRRHALAQHIVERFGPEGTVIGPTGQMGSVAAYGALSRRKVCPLGSGGGTCLDGHAMRTSLDACVAALLQSCHDGVDTPYVLELFGQERLDTHTSALHAALTADFELTLTQDARGREIKVYALNERQLRAIGEDVR